YVGSNNVNLNGGNYLSNNLNIYAGSGSISTNVGTVSGNLNTAAGQAHVLASTPNLVLGSNAVSGDPIFANSGGNIVISTTSSN
ncbi:hypothetical protein ABTJ37_22745, partial [Acinetobacter baumannii]